MVRPTTVFKGGVIFLPVSTNYPKFKVVVNNTDITSDIVSASVVRVATKRLSYFTLNMENYQGKYNNSWDEINDKIDVDIYVDYANSSNFTTFTPTNRIFHGNIDSINKGLSSSGHTMEIKGRAFPELADRTTTIEFDKENIKEAIKTLIDNFNVAVGSELIRWSEDSIDDTSITTSANYRDMKYINILTDLAERADFDFRIDPNGLFNAFKVGTKKCYKESIASGVNLILLPTVGYDGLEVKNYIKVYGPEKEDCLIMWTKKQTIPKPWRKDLIINDTSNNNLEQCKDRAIKEYNNLSDAEIVARPSCVGMPYLKEGESVKCFAEYTDLDGDYVAQQVDHIFGINGYETRVSLSQLETNEKSLIKNNERDIREKSTFNNPNDMEYSYHFTFDDDTNVNTHSQTKTEDGRLKITTGNDSGTMESRTLDLDDTVNYAELRFNGNDDCDLCTFEVSFDGGGNWTTITPGLKGEPGFMAFIPGSGKQMRVKVNMKSSTAKPNPEIESLVLLGRKI